LMVPTSSLAKALPADTTRNAAAAAKIEFFMAFSYCLGEALSNPNVAATLQASYR
jgi:hypothetical protein